MNIKRNKEIYIVSSLIFCRKFYSDILIPRFSLTLFVPLWKMKFCCKKRYLVRLKTIFVLFDRLCSYVNVRHLQRRNFSASI